MLLALVTGQRREDIVRMKFSDVWDGHLHVIQGKTGMRLALPLTLYCDAVNMTLKDVIARCRAIKCRQQQIAITTLAARNG